MPVPSTSSTSNVSDQPVEVQPGQEPTQQQSQSQVSHSFWSSVKAAQDTAEATRASATTATDNEARLTTYTFSCISPNDSKDFTYISYQA